MDGETQRHHTSMGWKHGLCIGPPFWSQHHPAEQAEQPHQQVPARAAWNRMWERMIAAEPASRRERCKAKIKQCKSKARHARRRLAASGSNFLLILGMGHPSRGSETLCARRFLTAEG
jgi:hypothetical protein